MVDEYSGSVLCQSYLRDVLGNIILVGKLHGNGKSSGAASSKMPAGRKTMECWGSCNRVDSNRMGKKDPLECRERLIALDNSEFSCYL